jgi:hypothetical protein
VQVLGSDLAQGHQRTLGAKHRAQRPNFGHASQTSRHGRDQSQYRGSHTSTPPAQPAQRPRKLDLIHPERLRRSFHAHGLRCRHRGLGLVQTPA